MKVMIAYPPLQGRGTPLLGQNRQFQWFSHPMFIYPLVPAMAATLCRHQGWEVVWLDGIAEQLTAEEFLLKTKQAAPDVIAFESKTPVIKQHWAWLKEIKKNLPKSRLVLMGDHVTALPEESLHNSPADAVLQGGHFDVLLVSYVQALEKGGTWPLGIWVWKDGRTFSSGPASTQCDLNAQPFIDRDLTQWQRYGEKFFKRRPFAYTMAGRDCPWAKCRFCSWTTTFPRFSVRHPKHLLDEIDFLVRQYGVREIFDDTGTFPGGGWLTTFCEGLQARGLHKEIFFSANFRFDYLTEANARMMKASGFRLLKFGVESGNQDSLDRLCKGITLDRVEEGCRMAKRAGLGVHLTFMVGHPWETRAEGEKTYRLAKRLLESGLADMLQSTIMIPYPGTPLFLESVEQGWLRFPPGAWEKWDMTQTVLTTPDMEPDEVMWLCNKIYRAFMTFRFLLRQVISIRNWEDLVFLFRAGLAVIGHIRDFFRFEKKPSRILP